MSNYSRKQLKKLYGHPDYAPVLANDNLTASATGVQTVVGHTVADSWVLPRNTQIEGLIVMATGALNTGRLDYAVTYDGAVAVSGGLPAGVRSDAIFVPLARQNAVIADSGVLLEIVYAVPTDLGSAQTIRFAAPVCYIGKL